MSAHQPIQISRKETLILSNNTSHAKNWVFHHQVGFTTSVVSALCFFQYPLCGTEVSDPVSKRSHPEKSQKYFPRIFQPEDK